MYHRQGYVPFHPSQPYTLPETRYYGEITPEEITKFLDAVESLSTVFDLGSGFYWEILQSLYIGFD